MSTPMEAAHARRDAGMASAAEHAEHDAPGWGQRAYDAIVASPYLRAEPAWTMEFARQWVYACGLDQPTEERAWGPVTRKLMRDGMIEAVGYDAAASSNGSPKRTYRLR
jgi:hypothetical protein